MHRLPAPVPLAVSLGVAAAWAIAGCDFARTPALRALPIVEGATVVGTETCLSCHPSVAESLKGTVHSRPVTERPDGCESCHGPGSEHVASLTRGDSAGARASIRNVNVMRSLEPASRSGLCLECHARDVAHFFESRHAAAGISCWECHGAALHTRPPVTLSTPRPIIAEEEGPDGSTGRPLLTPGSAKAPVCYRCHSEIQGEFLLQFHHPVPEGRIRCADCHAVHAEPELLAAAGEDERCLGCHEEIRGPYIFEHLALEEGCTVCHTPHGSVADKLLAQANNGLCEQCHFDARFPLIGGVDHTRLLFGGALCYDCHFEVHGSNTDENFLPLRIDKPLLRKGYR